MLVQGPAFAYLPGSLTHSSSLLRSGVVRVLLGIGLDWMEQGFTAQSQDIVGTGATTAVVLKPAQ